MESANNNSPSSLKSSVDSESNDLDDVEYLNQQLSKLETNGELTNNKTFMHICEQAANNPGILLNSNANVIGYSYSGDEMGNRFNEGKAKLNLIPPEFINDLGKVFTYGAEKYGEDNYTKGLPYSNCAASAMRHLNAFMRGEDNDKESGYSHLLHVTSNMAMLYYQTLNMPNCDDRRLFRKEPVRIGLDIDEVLANFTEHYCNYFEFKGPVDSWNFDPEMSKNLNHIKDNKEFWTTVPMITKPDDIKFPVTCYITSRICPQEFTIEWLEKNGYPRAPVVHTDGKSKVGAAIEHKLQLFVDDNTNTFRELNQAGIACYLFDTCHNRRYNAGSKRISDFTHVNKFYE